ncbi:SAVED domain-containing protein [Micromonospora haikouensis]|uniref:SAVED domain-containing protein n=1 Tax=Micromonospora haikouensis TaxID=686309 RepID=UPI0037A172FC
MAGTATPSSSGARLTGDDVQHAVAWHSALRTLVPHAGVQSVTVEAANVGNVDDVVIAKATEPSEYIQVKAAVTAKEPATIDWLTTPTRSGGPSILQRFHRAFQDLRHDGRYPQLTLITNRSIDPDDPILTLRDRNDRLAHRLRNSAQAVTIAARRDIAAHLRCTEDELYELLDHLRLHTDASEAAWRDYHIRDISFAAGVRADESAFRLGLSEVREWVKTSRTEKRTADIAEAVDRLGIQVQDPFTVLAIKALDEELELPDAGVELDWVDRFRGTEARNRRGLKDPREWETVLRPQLLHAQRTLRSRGARRILITGTMRLPTWFTAGVMFQETAGFTPAKIKDGQLWVKPTHIITPAPIVLSSPVADLPTSAEMALALAISADPTEDVRRHIASTGLNLPIITAYLPGGVSNASVTDCNHAYGISLAIRDLAREIARTVNPPVIHLFMAAPAGLAVLLGGIWDRVPTTQTYEDLNGVGYEPAFLIPN